MIRFTQEFKTKWLEALRSGKYEQAHRFLRVGNAFCCLGVACEISGRGHWVEVQDAGIYSQPIKKFVFYSGSVVLPYNANIFSNMDPSIYVRGILKRSQIILKRMFFQKTKNKYEWFCACSQNGMATPEICAKQGCFTFPECSKCHKNDKVSIGPGTMGSDCWCERCKLGWEQPL